MTQFLSMMTDISDLASDFEIRTKTLNCHSRVALKFRSQYRRIVVQDTWWHQIIRHRMRVSPSSISLNPVSEIMPTDGKYTHTLLIGLDRLEKDGCHSRKEEKIS
ncbi:hypothetical protein HNY73_012311 [Argiope bruennichi]|uniref:Uncharacterized protein n=1 Tax=Argiope bruennichi TaxID=94029 RepID=A0A8T0EUL7_ARGBR|nr:hypothetical protein HNY73_012311 [Argiope bruennichi]